MKKPKKVKVVSEAAAKPCPKCGYCEQCGRSNQLQPIQITMPYVPPYIYPSVSPTVPAWPYWPTIIYSGAANDSTSYTVGGSLTTSGTYSVLQ